MIEARARAAEVGLRNLKIAKAEYSFDGSRVAFLFVTGLRPGRVPVMPHVRVTDDQFVLVVEQTDSVFDAARVGGLFAGCGAVRSEERVQPEAQS